MEMISYDSETYLPIKINIDDYQYKLAKKLRESLDLLDTSEPYPIDETGVALTFRATTYRTVGSKDYQKYKITIEKLEIEK